MHMYLGVVLFAVSTTVTPGPNILMILHSGLSHGIRRSIPHYLGICLGMPVMIALVGLFLGPIFTHYPVVHWVLKTIALAYLLFLAAKIATCHPHKMKDHAPIGFLQALFFQWVNPKVWVMALGAIAAYTHVGVALDRQIVAIGVIFLVVSFPCVGVWLVGSASLRRLLKSPLHFRIFNVTMALLLVLSIMPMLMTLVDAFNHHVL